MIQVLGFPKQEIRRFPMNCGRKFFLFIRLANVCLMVCLVAVTGQANGIRIDLSNFSARSGWQPWAQRVEILPRCYIDQTQFRSAPNALAISGNSNAAEYGGWSYRLDNIQPGKFYRLT